MTILIPTDFTLQSLNIIKNAAARFAEERLKIVLFHALHTPGDIQDLLFFMIEWVNLAISWGKPRN